MLIKWINLTIEQILVDENTTFSMARFERKRLEKNCISQKSFASLHL
jgi:hypothetical protein